MCKTKEALETIKAMEDTMITVSQAAEVLGSDPQSIRLQAREDQSALGFIKFIEGV